MREVVIPTFRKDTGVGEQRYTTSTGKNYGKSNNPKAGQQFIDAANATGVLVNAKPRIAGQRGQVSRKSTGRLIYRAWAADNGKTNEAVVRAIMKTNDLFMAKTSGFATSGVRKVA
jgi:hypothetical protein